MKFTLEIELGNGIQTLRDVLLATEASIQDYGSLNNGTRAVGRIGDWALIGDVIGATVGKWEVVADDAVVGSPDGRVRLMEVIQREHC